MIHLVVDVNVVISAVFNKGNSLKVFVLNRKNKFFDLISPQYLYIEIGKHTNRIAQKTKYSLEEATKILNFVIKQIRFIPDNKFSDKIGEANIILKGHEKDAHYLALALAFNCKIFSGDKNLKEIIPDMVLTLRGILEGFFTK